MSPSRVREAAEQSRLLLDKLGDLDLSSKTLKRLVKLLQKHEVKVQDLLDQQELVLQRLADAKSLVVVLKGQLDDKETLTRHSQQLHDQLSQSEIEAQQLGIRVQVCVCVCVCVCLCVCCDNHVYIKLMSTKSSLQWLTKISISQQSYML